MKRLILASMVATGCVTEDLATRESPIIGGVASVGTEATMLLAGFPPDRSVLHSCTAVLVSPTVLLTAAHCIDAATHPNYLYGVFTGDDASAYANLAALEPQLKMAASVHPHPQYSPNLPFYGDIGVVVLAAPLAITPATIQRDAIDTTMVSKPARIVGYGQTVYGQYNQQRHEAMTAVVALENDTIVVGDSQRRSCLGDSGGPAFVDGNVVGIDSYGPVGCNAPAHYRRVDTFMPFIERYVPAPTDPIDPDPTEDPTGEDTDDGGGCAASGGTTPLWIVLALVLVRPRRRRPNA